jgi:hypothetical protein
MNIPVRLAAASAAGLSILGASSAVALAPVTVPAKDPSQSVITRPTLVSRGQTVRVKEASQAPITPVRFKVYPDTYGYRPTNSSCQGRFFTAYKRTSDSGKVVGLDRIAVIAALNMANELIRFRNRDTNLDSDVGGRLRILRERVESALEKGRQLEL